ncbi:MAG: hypothetical protein FWC91_14245, partial [Defluviitaleaceae bacterium]|nr:hypothetical protein [Defluviitaleaceae bacterium]
MQSVSLSQGQLFGLMNILKETLTIFDEIHYRKTIFFNEWSLYQHIREFEAYKTTDIVHKYDKVGVLLDDLEPYIPFRLTEENFDLFMEAVLKPHEENHFIAHKAKMDFVMAIREIELPDQWEQALNVCEAIRALRE